MRLTDERLLARVGVYVLFLLTAESGRPHVNRDQIGFCSLLWTETALKEPHLSLRYTFVLPDTVRDRCSSGGQGLATFCLHSGT